jgi:arsenate reductase (glutaredoxin)
MLTLYGIPNCDTVKKARTWLDSRGVAYEFHDYKKKGITRKKLDHWLSQTSWEKLTNRAGTTWRKLPEEQKSAVSDAASAAELLVSNTSAIKRPLIENAAGRVVVLGFSEKEYEQIFA